MWTLPTASWVVELVHYCQMKRSVVQTGEDFSCIGLQTASRDTYSPHYSFSPHSNSYHIIPFSIGILFDCIWVPKALLQLSPSVVLRLRHASGDWLIIKCLVWFDWLLFQWVYPNTCAARVDWDFMHECLCPFQPKAG